MKTKGLDDAPEEPPLRAAVAQASTAQTNELKVDDEVRGRGDRDDERAESDVGLQ